MILGYWSALAACLLLAVAVSFTPLGGAIDNNVYDWLLRLNPPPAAAPQSALLVVDDASLTAIGGMRRLRGSLAQALERIAAARPAAVAIDIQLADEGDAAEDAQLEAALARTPNLVLACDMTPGGWQEPLARFRKRAAAVGHAHSRPDSLDMVTRQIPLMKVAGQFDRRWALSLEAFRLARGAGHVVETPEDLEIGRTTVPARDGRLLRVRFVPELESVSLRQALAPGAPLTQFTGKTVFVGVTSQTAAQDRWMTPVSNGLPMPGVEIHAHAFETLARGRFLTDAPATAMLVACLLAALTAGAVFWYISGWPAYAAGAGLLAVAHAVPALLFSRDIVFPFFAPAATAWLAVGVSASYQHFVVRRLLRKTEIEKGRYQQAIRFVTHEMRTPLTAIQGSSELMGRYNLPEDKRKQIAEMIHSESKRLASMIRTFLDVEKLSAGQMELKRERFGVGEVVDLCLLRVSPVAEKKRIVLERLEIPEAVLTGDRELMEYAVYNLLTNAIKYSPAETTVRVAGALDGGSLRLEVADQGIGMDEKELKRIFTKFYRTKKAEASGEAGTGIGLSIVEQIVTHHGGRIEVASQPGKGSCFTLVLPAMHNS
ncbi:MAG: CHASE2 domain-containing protein [Acidobacteria bacterium]|nr:CHASE2 domain-containing protein [Acidobacteriota bacterium]